MQLTDISGLSLQFLPIIHSPQQVDTPLVECAVFFTVLLETRLKMKNYVSLKTGNAEFE